MVNLGGGQFGSNAHSIKRMNSGSSFIRLAGINTNLISIAPIPILVDGNFSGDPLSMVSFRPEQSPLPWMYVADRNQMRKISMSLVDYLMGVATPLNPPKTAPSNEPVFGPQSLQDIYNFNTGAPATDWVAGGTAAVQASASATDTILAALPDTTSNAGGVSFLPDFVSIVQNGSASIFPTGSIVNFRHNKLVGQPVPIINNFHVSWTTSSISKIVYLSGTLGQCTITMPSVAQILPDHMVVRLNSGGASDEYVQARKCVQNPDGTFTFLAFTLNPHFSGESITAEDTLRCYITTTLNSFELPTTIMELDSMTSTLTTGTGSWVLTALKDLSTTNLNGVRPIQITAPADSIYIGFNTNNQGSTTSLKIDLDVDATTNNFSSNYYTYTTTSFSGSGVWKVIAIPITSLTRIGSDTTRTLANVAAIRLTVVAGANLTISFSSFWIGGNYGPYQGVSGLPYQYLVVARSTATGAFSNGSPATLDAIKTVAGGSSIAVYVDQHNFDPQVDVYDVYRFGGSLPSWIFIGTMPNPSTTQKSVLFDVFQDTAIAASPQLQTDNFQPFPTVDIPRTGVVNVNGSTVTWVSGDMFDIRWSQGTLITINGNVYSFYQQPTNQLGTLPNTATQVQLNQVAGQLTNVSYKINQATILGVPLPFLWGPFAQGTASFFFACGDLNQPGVLFLTKGNNPDSAPDALQIEITSPSEPLINGCMYDGTAFVWSSDRLFRLYPLFGQSVIVTNGTVSPAQGTNLFTPIEIPNGKGLIAPWGIAVGPKIWFIARDGIYETTGSEPQSITGKDWAMLFPNEGFSGTETLQGQGQSGYQLVNLPSINLLGSVPPPDFNFPKKLRLSYYDSMLYFDFQDTGGNQRTLAYDTATDTWSYDVYNPGVNLHYGEEGLVHSTLLAGIDGNVYSMEGQTDGNSAPFPCGVIGSLMTEGTSKYQSTRSGYLGLLAQQPGVVSVGMQADGVQQFVSVNVGPNYTNIHSEMPAMKGRLEQWFVSAPFPFILIMRDAEFLIREWGADGPYRKVNPFASFRRAAQPRAE